MTEEQFVQLEKILNASNTDISKNNRTYYRRQFEDAVKLAQADIARQLTRIADAMEIQNPQWKTEVAE